MNDDKVTLYTCPQVTTGDDVLERLQAIGRDPHVLSVVGLPEIHLKPKLETPSSVAIATRGALCAQLSSPSPNCGMAMLALDLSAAEAAARVDELMVAVRALVPMKRSPYRLTTAEALAAMEQGAGFTRARFDELDLPVERVDDGGALAAPPAEELQGLVPKALQRIAATDYGALGGGNHFLELEEVAGVLDPPAAARFGLTEGQAVILYHTGSGMFGYEMGRLYSYRRKISPKYLPRIMARKVAFHGARGQNWEERARRWRLFVRPARWSWVDEDLCEAEEMRIALDLAMNFGYANRAAVAVAIAAAVHAVFGDVPVRLVFDSSHNSIGRQGGDWIHRHNASRAIPVAGDDGGSFAGIGHPILLPGTDRSSSYVCRPGARVADSLFSVDHGAGSTVTALGVPRGDGAETIRFRYSGAREPVDHLTDDGIECVLGALRGSDLAHPVARTTPLAVLKE
jgi:tRNA-splicing ligase RtcB